MDILKNNSVTKPPVLVSVGSRNNTILNKIKTTNINSNQNINLLKVIKNKHKNIKNKMNNSKNNFQTNSNSINKQIYFNIKDNFPNKLLSRVFSYRKIEKNSNKIAANNNLKSSNKNVNTKDPILLKKKEDRNNLDVPISNNVTNNITNNITNIFINNENKNKKNENLNTNLSEKNNKNEKITKIMNNLTSSNPNKNKSLTKKIH